MLGAVGFSPRAARDRAGVARRARRRPALRRGHRHPLEVRGHGHRRPDAPTSSRPSSRSTCPRSTASSPRRSWPTTASPSCPPEEQAQRAAGLDRHHRGARRSSASCGTTRPSSSPTPWAPRPRTSSRRSSRTGRLIGALCGSVRHALKHKAAGLDFVVCQGTEGGGHCGEVSVAGAVAPGHRRHRAGCRCWPPAASATAARWRRPWRWAPPAHGPGRCGSRSRRPTCRRPRCRPTSTPPATTPCARGPSPASRAACCATTGPTRGRREDTPDPLPMPLQMMVALDAVQRGHRYPEAAKDVNFNPVGQVVGQLNQHRAHRPGRPAPRRGVRRGLRAPQAPQLRRPRLRSRSGGAGAPGCARRASSAP